MSSQPAKICKLASKTDNPKSRIEDAEETEHAKTNPIGRYEHARGTRVECCADIIRESGLHGLLILLFAVLFSNTLRNASVTTIVAFLNSGRS